ncbi:hypothetical protein [Moorena sp. SIO4G3]|nr:hypothetical protein [Moorena sp. SIO4G3]
MSNIDKITAHEQLFSELTLEEITVLEAGLFIVRLLEFRWVCPG